MPQTPGEWCREQKAKPSDKLTICDHDGLYAVTYWVCSIGESDVELTDGHEELTWVAILPGRKYVLNGPSWIDEPLSDAK